MDDLFFVCLLLLCVLAIFSFTENEDSSQSELISSIIEERYWDEKLSRKSTYLSDDDGNRYLDEGNVDGTDVYFYYVLDSEGAIERRYAETSLSKISETLEKGRNPFVRTYYSMKVTTDNSTNPPTVKEEWSDWPAMRKIFYFPEVEYYEGMQIEAN